jgi:hypothetical protein
VLPRIEARRVLLARPDAPHALEGAGLHDLAQHELEDVHRACFVDAKGARSASPDRRSVVPALQRSDGTGRERVVSHARILSRIVCAPRQAKRSCA